jgi:hypothetical protein
MAHPGLVWPVPAGTPITDQPSNPAALLVLSPEVNPSIQGFRLNGR